MPWPLGTGSAFGREEWDPLNARPVGWMDIAGPASWPHSHNPAGSQPEHVPLEVSVGVGVPVTCAWSNGVDDRVSWVPIANTR